MATIKQTIAIGVELTGDQVAAGIDKSNASVKSLKTQLKEATLAAMQFGDATTKEAIEAQKRVAQLKEEINDFKDRIDALHPEAKFAAFSKVASGIAGGFAAAQGAMALFGTESEELQKTLLKVQAALALSQGINEIKGLSDAMGNLQVVATDAFNNIKKAILNNPLTTGLVVAGIAAVTAAIIYLVTKTDEETEAINKQIESNRKKFDLIEKGYDREIALAKAAGKNTLGLEKDKLEAVIKRIEKELELEEKKNALLIKRQVEFVESFFTNEELIKEIRERSKKQEFTDTEELKKLRESLSNARLELDVKEVEINKKKQDDFKAAAAERNKIIDEENKKREEQLKKFAENEKAESDFEAEDLAKRLKESAAFEEERRKHENDALEFSARIAAAQQALDKETQDKKRAELTATRKFEQEQLQQGFNIATAFFDTQLNFRLKQAEGNEAAQEKIRKKFFERQKKVQIAQALMSTYQGASNAFTATAANIPLTAAFPAAPYIAAASATALGLLNVRKISQTQFESSGGGDGGGGLNAPSIDVAGGKGFNDVQGTAVNDNGTIGNQNVNNNPSTPAVTKVYVVASEVDNVNNLNKQITKLSTV